jgi:SAM-dependent methyltransferase
VEITPMLDLADPVLADPIAWDQAADHYGHPANSFRDRLGARAVARLGIMPGMHVLDACAGTGAATIPAARRAGVTGRVIGIDTSARLLGIARARGRAHHLRNLRFVQADVLHLDAAPMTQDAIVCAFGLQHLEDPVVGLARLWELLRPGGRLLIAAWGRNLFAPAHAALSEAMHAERPDLDADLLPWHRLADERDLASAFTAAGIDDVEVAHETGSHPIHSSDDWWAMVLGSGYRALVERLDPVARARVRAATCAALDEAAVGAVVLPVLYATAVRAA